MVSSTHVYYKAGYKYKLADTLKLYIPIRLPRTLSTESGWVKLSTDGLLTLRKGYCSDGPSGIAIDTKNFMRGAYVHDALYQLMRVGELPRSFRQEVDKLLQSHCREDGMTKLRSWWVYKGVRIGGAKSASEAGIRPIHKAP